MNSYILNATETVKWMSVLENFNRLDCSFLPDYHLAYCSGDKSSQALMYVLECSDNIFAYPFILSEVPKSFSGTEETFYDISSVYGYSGPLMKSFDQEFANLAWSKFDNWALSNNVICEFIRFSFYNNNLINAHPDARVTVNRSIAVSHFNLSEDEHRKKLGPKTRNMIAKAVSFGLNLRPLDFNEDYPRFKIFYDQLMIKNSAPQFFFYSDEYYRKLGKLASESLRLYGVFKNDDLVGGIILIIYKNYALYHLGALKDGLNKLGCSNFYLFEVWKILHSEGIEVLNLGGGRTTDPDDPLLKFKIRNSNKVEKFYIGTRTINKNAYQQVKNIYLSKTNDNMPLTKLQFYRS